MCESESVPCAGTCPRLCRATAGQHSVARHVPLACCEDSCRTPDSAWAAVGAVGAGGVRGAEEQWSATANGPRRWDTCASSRPRSHRNRAKLRGTAHFCASGEFIALAYGTGISLRVPPPSPPLPSPPLPSLTQAGSRSVHCAAQPLPQCPAESTRSHTANKAHGGEKDRLGGFWYVILSACCSTLSPRLLLHSTLHMECQFMIGLRCTTRASRAVNLGEALPHTPPASQRLSFPSPFLLSPHSEHGTKDRERRTSPPNHRCRHTRAAVATPRQRQRQRNATPTPRHAPPLHASEPQHDAPPPTTQRRPTTAPRASTASPPPPPRPARPRPPTRHQWHRPPE